jgi:dihydrofolate reductase
MRKLKYYIACSIDGFIAHEDGSWNGFLMEGEHVTDYLDSLQKWFDIVLMGRRTYEIGLTQGITDPFPHLRSYVFSRTMPVSPNERVTLVSENTGEVVRNLKSETGKDIYLCGGADLATALLNEALIDEIILKMNPFMMGSGIPLFSIMISQTDLELISHKIYQNGMLLLHYQVKKQIA